MSAHATHTMHENSLNTWANLDTSRRRSLILEAMQRANRPITDRELLAHLVATHGIPDEPNAVRPRLSELLKEGVLIETGKRADRFTNRKVRTTWLKNRPLPERV